MPISSRLNNHTKISTSFFKDRRYSTTLSVCPYVTKSVSLFSTFFSDLYTRPYVYLATHRSAIWLKSHGRGPLSIQSIFCGSEVDEFEKNQSWMNLINKLHKSFEIELSPDHMDMIYQSSLKSPLWWTLYKNKS